MYVHVHVHMYDLTQRSEVRFTDGYKNVTVSSCSGRLCTLLLSGGRIGKLHIPYFGGFLRYIAHGRIHHVLRILWYAYTISMVGTWALLNAQFAIIAGPVKCGYAAKMLAAHERHYDLLYSLEIEHLAALSYSSYTVYQCASSTNG